MHSQSQKSFIDTYIQYIDVIKHSVTCRWTAGSKKLLRSKEFTAKFSIKDVSNYRISNPSTTSVSNMTDRQLHFRDILPCLLLFLTTTKSSSTFPGVVTRETPLTERCCELQERETTMHVGWESTVYWQRQNTFTVYNVNFTTLLQAQCKTKLI